MRKLQPKGPYRVLGWSFGGIVVQEVAAQLEAQGEALEMSILLDSALSGDEFPDLGHIDDTDLLIDQAEALGIAVEGLGEESLKEAILLAAKGDGFFPVAAEISDLDMMLQMVRHAPTLMAKWARCRQLTAPITFVRASDNARSDLQERLTEVTSGCVQIYDVPAIHTKMCDQSHSPIIAALLERILN
jgi:thioesterase domain-containing protein